MCSCSGKVVVLVVFCWWWCRCGCVMWVVVNWFWIVVWKMCRFMLCIGFVVLKRLNGLFIFVCSWNYWCELCGVVLCGGVCVVGSIGCSEVGYFGGGCVGGW